MCYAVGYGGGEMSKCYGFKNPGKCDRPPGKNPYWCDECNEARIEHITAQMRGIVAEMKERYD